MGLDADFYRTTRAAFNEGLKALELRNKSSKLWSALFEKADAKYGISKKYEEEKNALGHKVAWDNYLKFRDKCYNDEEFAAELEECRKAHTAYDNQRLKPRLYGENLEYSDSWKTYDFITKFFGKESDKIIDYEDFNCTQIEIPRDKVEQLRNKYLEESKDVLTKLFDAKSKAAEFNRSFFKEDEPTAETKKGKWEDVVDYRIALLDKIIKWYDEDYEVGECRVENDDGESIKTEDCEMIPQKDRVIFYSPWF